MKKLLSNVFLACMGLILMFSCNGPGLEVKEKEPVPDEGEIVEYDGVPVKIGELTDSDIENGITRAIFINPAATREDTRGVPAGGRYITAIIRDGAANSEGVKYMFTAGMNRSSGILGLVGTYMPHNLFTSEPSDAEKEIMYWKNWWINNYGINQGSQCVLLVGKSIGAAMLYRSLYRCYYSKSRYIGLQNFFKVGVVLFDAHEPGAPGDSGDYAKWYDYVYFDAMMGSPGYYYNLRFWPNWTNYINPARRQYAQLGIYNTYQRHDSLWRGYSFLGSYAGSTYVITNIKQNVDHDEIDSDPYSLILGADMIENCIEQFICGPKD
ncbi:MAG: hypothetical protein JW881_14530 [Spirochaetales bacterium]|nr:hypothetical protein [Spirochaetales bacterium]